MNLIELCRKLTAIDSSISHGTRDIAAAIAEVAVVWGLDAEIENEMLDGVENANVILRTKNSQRAQKQLLLVTHLDTEDPGEYARWIRTGANPYNASIDGDFIYGLGIADAKADLTCKLLAMKEFAENKFNELAPVFVGTFGLSSGMGAIRLIRKKKVRGQLALVSGPTQMRLATTGAGYAKVEVSIPFSIAERHYRNEHNLAENSVSQSKIFSRPSEKKISLDIFDNPIMKLIEYLKNMPEGITLIAADGGSSPAVEPESAFLELDIHAGASENVLEKLVKIREALIRFSAELKTVSADNQVGVFSTITLGTIRTFPDEIKLSGICRLIPTKKEEIYEHWLEKFRNDCESAGAQFRVLDFKPPFVTQPSSLYSKTLAEEMNLKSEQDPYCATLACTDANVLSRFGVESYVFGPGRLSGTPQVSHEKISVADLPRVQEFYTSIIRRLCK